MRMSVGMSARYLATLVLFIATSHHTTAYAQHETEVVASVDGAQITRQQLDDALGASLIQVETQAFNARRAKLDALINGMLVAKAAKARNQTPEEFKRASLDRLITPVSEEEARAVYESARDQFASMAPAEAIAMLRARMQRQRSTQKEAEFYASLRAAAGVQIALAPPRVTVASQKDRARGPEAAPVRIVEFSDFQCSFCAKHRLVLAQISERYGDRVRLEFRDFPLSLHAQAPRAAEAARCADAQGKFWELHDVLFANQQALQLPDLKRHATAVGLDMPAFTACMDEATFAADVTRDLELGQSLAISGTPTTFINGRLVLGSASFENIARIIDDELASKGRTSGPSDTSATNAGSRSLDR
jgi:protein-disulfide isomerase